MIKKPNKKLIGFFSITSIILFLAIIISLSGIKAFKLKDDKLVMFFNESIKKLCYHNISTYKSSSKATTR